MKHTQTHREPPLTGSLSPWKESQQEFSPTSGIYALPQPPAAAPCGSDSQDFIPLTIEELLAGPAAEKMDAVLEMLNVPKRVK